MNASVSEGMFMLVDKRWFRTDVTDVLGSVIDCYVGKPLHDGHGGLVDVQTERSLLVKRWKMMR